MGQHDGADSGEPFCLALRFIYCRSSLLLCQADGLKQIVTVQGGYGVSGFQASLRPRIVKNQAQLGSSRLFYELKPSFSHDPLNAYSKSQAASSN
jgi:hypothetical protein